MDSSNPPTSPTIPQHVSSTEKVDSSAPPPTPIFPPEAPPKVSIRVSPPVSRLTPSPQSPHAQTQRPFRLSRLPNVNRGRLPVVQISQQQRFLFRRAMATQFQPIVLCGPSGSGKSTIVKKLMAEYDGCFAFSVSHTTRKPRPGEEHGKDYFFSDRDSMEKMIENKEFIETAEFSGNLYGTSIKAVQDIQSTGKICILDVDMEGVKAIKKTDLNPRYIFVKPPSEEVLEQRLRGRGTENEDSLLKRLARAKAELEFGATPGTFDSTVVNDNLEDAYQQMKGILIKEIEAIIKWKKLRKQ